MNDGLSVDILAEALDLNPREPQARINYSELKTGLEAHQRHLAGKWESNFSRRNIFTYESAVAYGIIHWNQSPITKGGVRDAYGFARVGADALKIWYRHLEKKGYTLFSDNFSLKELGRVK